MRLVEDVVLRCGRVAAPGVGAAVGVPSPVGCDVHPAAKRQMSSSPAIRTP
ncbi:MAG TPA: hypothetical protein PK336_00610 [Methanoculleus sp.]|nr:hypothetical protein [Methanoculleus sp.]